VTTAGLRCCRGDDVTWPLVTQHGQLLTYHWSIELIETDKSATAAPACRRHEQDPCQVDYLVDSIRHPLQLTCFVLGVNT